MSGHEKKVPVGGVIMATHKHLSAAAKEKRGPKPAMLQEAAFRVMLESGVVQEVIIIGRPRRFEIAVALGKRPLPRLAGTRGSVRAFASLATAGNYVARLGIAKFVVDMTHYRPGRLRPPRPDRANALRQQVTPTAAIPAPAPGKRRA